eukprot:scaffold14425_cov63-Skeletonema_menzelii.AAC.1
MAIFYGMNEKRGLVVASIEDLIAASSYRHTHGQVCKGVSDYKALLHAAGKKFHLLGLGSSRRHSMACNPSKKPNAIANVMYMSGRRRAELHFYSNCR